MSHDRHYIGGGLIAAVANINPMITRLHAYHAIQGGVIQIDEEQEQFFRRRKSLENYAVEMLRERKYEVIRQNERYSHPVVEHFKAELDAEVTGAPKRRAAELKSVHPFAAKVPGKTWGDEGTTEIPDYVLCQVQWQLTIADLDEAVVLAIIGFDDSRAYPVMRDREVGQILLDTADKFWREHILTCIPPPITNLADIEDFVTPILGKIVDARDLGIAKEVAELREARKAVKNAEGLKEALTEAIKLKMVDATHLTLDGQTVVTWKEHERNDLDVSKIRAAEPAIAAKYNRKNPVRSFLFKDTK